MLREKRRHSNFKPNRRYFHHNKNTFDVSKTYFFHSWSLRLDAKSSRGMIYENEELRLRTININAEVEKGKLQNNGKHLTSKSTIIRLYFMFFRSVGYQKTKERKWTAEKRDLDVTRWIRQVREEHSFKTGQW